MTVAIVFTKFQEDDEKLAFKGVSKEYTQEDFSSAFSLLTEGAIRYFKTGPGAVPLDAFEVKTLQPHEFREQLKMVFNVKVALPELWALVAHFDKEGRGTINCERFLTQFFRTGYEERVRIQQSWRGMEVKAQAEMKKHKEDVLEQERLIGWSEVDFHFSEDEFDGALKILITMCYKFDHRQLGPAGYAPFESASMTPREFREMLKRTFNVKVSERELGALVAYFDTTLPPKRVVNNTMFLNSLVQIRVSCNEFKNKRGEAAKMRDLETQLKEAYHLRIRRQPGADSRPWRPNDQLSPAKFKVGGIKRFTYPVNTPLEKYKRRLIVAKQNQILDLSTNRYMSEGHVGVANLTVNAAGEVVALEQEGSTAEEDASLAGSGDDQDTPAQTSQTEEEAEEQSRLEREGIIMDIRSSKYDRLEDRVIIESSGFWDECADHGRDVHADELTTATQTKALFPKFVPKTEEGRKATGKIATLLNNVQSETQYQNFKLDFVPQEIFELEDLTQLWLDNNLLTVVPSAIGELKRLEVLSMCNNQLTTIPPEVCLLERLQRLLLIGNKLMHLPNLMGRLKKLTELDISNNQFEDFPIVLTTSVSIVNIKATNNKFITLPPQLTHLKTLIKLDLTGCNITSAPEALMKMPWLRVLGCPIPVADTSSLPFEISGLETEILSNLLKSRAHATYLAKKYRRQKKNAYAVVMGGG